VIWTVRVIPTDATVVELVTGRGTLVLTELTGENAIDWTPRISVLVIVLPPVRVSTRVHVPAK
jgi:hypothetical protein